MVTPQGGRRRGGGPGSEAHGGLCPLSSDVVQAWVTGSVGSWKLWAEHGSLHSCLGDGHTQSHPARMPQGQRGVPVLVRAAGLTGRGAALDSAVVTPQVHVVVEAEGRGSSGEKGLLFPGPTPLPPVSTPRF